VIINGITVEQALKACDLHGVIPVNTIYSRVKARRNNGTYNILLRKAEEKRMIGNLVVDITGDDDDNDALSPITMDSTASLATSSNSIAVVGSSVSQQQHQKAVDVNYFLRS
jgi:hypothetical protein